MQNWFESTIVQSGRLPLFILLVSFLAAFLFIRLSVRMIRAEVRWWPGNIQPGGLHVHHVIFGLVAMLISGLGMITLANYSTPIANAVLAGLFGIGAALVLDEFALVLYLDDVYWLERGRASVDAIFVAVAVMGLFVVGFRPLGFDGSINDLLNDQDMATLITTAILLAVFAGLAIITLLKGKLWTGMLGLFLLLPLVVGAWRLSRPGAPWARWFYGTRPMKQARAASREERYRQPVVRAKIAVQEAVSGRFGDVLAPEPAETPEPAAEPAPAARRVEGVGERLANAIRWRRTRRRLRRAPLWRLPTVLVSVSVVMALAMTTFDGELVDENGQSLLAGLDASSTATFLSVIAGGMITLAGLVFTALTLAMQFGASQLSIRVVPLLQQSPIMRWSIGMFLATFTFALITAFDLATTTEAVPLFSTIVALMMAVASTLVLIALVTQVSNVLNPGKLLGQIADSGRVAVHRMFPGHEPGPAEVAPPAIASGPARVIALRNTSPDGRVLLVVNSIRIARLARRWGVSIVVEPAIGDFVSVGSPLFTVRGPQQRVRPAVLRRNLVFGESHSPDVSPAAAIQSIVDIALKALSPAINDPSRAVQAIDFLEDLLMLLASKAPATAIAEAGEVRTRVFVWESYVAMTVDEIRNFSPDSLMVQRRLRAMLSNLLAVCSDHHRAPVAERLAALDDMAARRWHNALDARLSHTPDMQGFGRSSDLEPEIG